MLRARLAGGASVAVLLLATVALLASCGEIVSSEEARAGSAVLERVRTPSAWGLMRTTFLGNTPDVVAWTYLVPSDDPVATSDVSLPPGFVEEPVGSHAVAGGWATVARWVGPCPTFDGKCTVRLDTKSAESPRAQLVASCVKATGDA